MSWKSLILLLLLLLLQQGASAVAGPENGQMDLTRDSDKTLLVAVPKHFPPQYSLDENGKPSGFAIDVLTHIAEQIGVSLEYRVKTSWPETFQALKKGEVDLIPNLGISKKRLAHYDYTRPVEAMPIYIFVRASDYEIMDADDLGNKKVGTVKGNVSITLISKIPGTTTIAYDNVESMILGLLSTEVDAIVYPLPWTLYTARRAGLEGLIKKAGPSIFEVKRAMAVRKGDQKLLNALNTELESFVRTHKYQDLYTKWYGNEKPYWTIDRVLQIGGGLLVIVLTIMLLLHYRIVVRSNAEYKAILTGKKNADMALDNERALLKSLIDSVPDLIFFKDKSSVYLGCNKAFAEYFGREEIDWLGKSDLDFFPKEEAEFYRNKDRKMLESGKPRQNEERLPAANGQSQLFETIKTPYYGPDGNVLGLIGISRDITERNNAEIALRENEARLQSILDNTPAVIYVKDIDGRFMLINRRFEKIFNISNEDVQGKVDHDLFPPVAADAFRENDLEVIRQRKAIEYEETVPHDDGLHRYLSVKFCLFGEDGEPYAICGISTDVTGQKVQEEKLRRIQKMDALGKLTGGIAHDFNNMLNVVIGYSEILSRSLKDNPKLEKFAQEIRHAGERGSSMTAKLLSFSRDRAEEEDRLDVNDFIIGERDLLETTLTARVQLEFELAESVWPVWLDKGDLEDAVINLCINAMHAMPENGALKITTTNISMSDIDAKQYDMQAGDYVQLSINDTGVGMDELTQAKIFDPFFTTKGEMGTGLGLSQVYGFIQRSHGDIRVFSTQGVGTRVVMHFPRFLGDEIEDKKETELDEAALQGDETILVVDDETSLLMLAELFLGENGYRVLTSESGEAALEILAKEKVDLVVSDVIMQGMDGYQLVSKVRELYPDIKLQLASGYTDDKLDHEGSDELRKNLLQKPFTIDALLRRVRTVLDEA